MQAANRLQRALCSGSGQSFGAWQMLPGTNHSRTIARCGYDWIAVDTEHGNIDDSSMHEAVAAIAACSVSPVVRIAANEGWMVKRALDAGAHGIIVPLLYTADDARKLVKSAKFPPVGQRGFGSPFSMEKFGGQTLSLLEGIAEVPGIDVLFVGPFDLGNNIGRPILDGTMHPELKEAIAKIQKVAKANDKSTGIYATSGDQAREFADQGFHMISVVADMVALPTYMTAALSAAKGSIAHSALNMAKGAASKLGSSNE